MTDSNGTPPPAGDAATPPAGQAPPATPPQTPPATGGVDYKAEAEKAAAEAEKWKGLARKHEERAKANADAAAGAKTVEQQLEELRKQNAERDIQDIQRSGRMARTQVEAGVAAAGFNPADVAALLDRIDSVSLLKDGEPDKKAVDDVVASLVKAAGRVTPDRDQGQRGGNGPLDMNALIRRRAGIGQ